MGGGFTDQIASNRKEMGMICLGCAGGLLRVPLFLICLRPFSFFLGVYVPQPQWNLHM